MRKYIIPAIMLTIIVLLTILIFLINLNKEEKFLYNGTYEQVTMNYLNNELYSTQTEKITLDNGSLFYEKEIKYQNGESDLKISKKYKYEEESEGIKIENEKYLIKEDKICFDTSCELSYSKEKNERSVNLDDVDSSKALINIDSLEQIKKQKGLSFVVIVQTGCIHCERLENILNSIIYDYNVKFNILNIRKVKTEVRDEIINDFKVTGTPTVMIFKDGEIIDFIDHSLSKQDLALLLTEKGLKNH